jgi:hypothetical protein
MSHSSRSWYLASAAAVVGVAVLWAGFSRYAVAAPDDPPKKEEPKKDPAKKEDPKKDPPGFPDIEDLIKQLPDGVDPEQIKRMQQQMRKMMEEMRKRFPDGIPADLNGFGGLGGLGGLPGMTDTARRRDNARLGAIVDKPSATLAEQLDLPKGQGIVVEEVMADSAAAKAGIKSHDILLEINGKDVPADARDFAKMLDDIKPNKAVDVVVLRKGKRVTVKGLSLPEAKEERGRERPELPRLGDLPGGIGDIRGRLGGAGLPGLPGMPGGKGVMTTIFRNDDRYTARHQEGSLIITVTGTVADGKAKVSDIRVQDGRESNKYESVDKVPERYRDKVKSLVEMSGKGAVNIEFKEIKDKQ